jgi:hypothetical protein
MNQKEAESKPTETFLTKLLYAPADSSGLGKINPLTLAHDNFQTHPG